MTVLLNPYSVLPPEPPVDPGDDVLVETVTLENWSGASRTDPYFTFRRFFEAGAVPTGAKVDLRYSSTSLTVQQADGVTLHSDGSLRAATFSGKLPAGAMADNATASLALYKTAGAFSNTTSISRSTLTGHDFKIRVEIGGTDYYCLLNNLDTAGTYRELRAGAAVRAWHHYGVLRAGQGGSDTDHGTMQGRFYSYVWEDGRVTVWAEMLVGRVAAAGDLTVTEFELLDGATSLHLDTTGFTAYAHSTYPLVGTDAMPIWTSSATHLHARISPAYLHAKKLLWNIQAGATQVAAIGAGTAIDHAPNQLSGWGPIDGGGGNAWIGPVTDWSALALLSGQKTRWRNDRVQALAQGWLSPDAYVDPATGYLPPLNNTTYSGLATKQPSIGWGISQTITNTGTGGPNGGSGDPWSSLNTSHAPSYAYLQYLATGGEWWLDRMVQRIGGALGHYNPGAGSDNYTRNPLIDGVRFYGTFMPAGNTMREGAWGLRDADNAAWVIPDANPNAPYMRDIRDETVGSAQQLLASRDSDMDTLGIWPGIAYVDTSDFASPPWQFGYVSLVSFQALNRGTIASDHLMIDSISKWYFGAVIACPYHAMGALTICYRQGSNPTVASPIATDWTQVYYGAGTAGTQTTKLISDSAGSSGSCPASGQSTINNEAYAARHTYPSIAHAAAAIGTLMGITNASTALTPLAAREVALSLDGDITDWNDRSVWRMRAP